MCGIAGWFDPRRRSTGQDVSGLARAMADRIAHRGPDDAQAWTDEVAGIGLGFRRLAIVDLTEAGRQPMVSASGRTVIIYNGEVYNAEELRRDLAGRGIAWRGHSDTEVILEACEAWGVKATAERLIGMFAIALWSREDRQLSLVRDRLGIKPLYVASAGSAVLFASELKALAAHPAWAGRLDRGAMAAYLRFGYVPGTSCIYAGAEKLRPGTILRIDSTGARRTEAFWDAVAVARDGIAERRAMSNADAVERLDALLRDAVARRMIADVPLGAFLSGGIDSSTVVALMQAQSARPVRTFTIGFREEGYDEAGHARAIARHLGTDHTELVVEPQHALDVVPRLADMYDEPFADSSQIPTFLVSALARRHVTVSLSGDGGDELFAGYTRYALGDRIGRVLADVPAPLRRAGACALAAVPAGAWNAVARAMPARMRPWLPADRVRKLAAILGESGIDTAYRRLVSLVPDPEAMAPGVTESVDGIWSADLPTDDPVERMQIIDLVTYLPEDILAKVDRASMSVSLEARVPLLDHRVVALSWALPPGAKRRRGKGKWALRQVLARYVPEALFERPKMGFGVPIDAWLRGPLRDWAEDLLSPASLRAHGLLAEAQVRTLWESHLDGSRNAQYPLWTILMLQAWMHRWQPTA
ncbi:MAG: asparagine synthase (glutamine-hydrolyzing) [Alphaproteobacteria bacterium]|nr:asparagine synthase (glutamine-hydrolyzing) [Alphaproteobacteria bacterium]